VAATPAGNILVTDAADKAVRVVAIARGNTVPIAGNTTVGAPDNETGIVIGTVKVTDADGDPLTYSISGGPANGTVTVSSTGGAFTYTPSLAARQAALTTSYTDTDSFTIRASDGFATKDMPVTVTIDPANRRPVIQTVTTSYDPATGTTTGKIIAVDQENDRLTYSVYGYQPYLGSLTLNPDTGDFTYTPLEVTPGYETVESIYFAVGDAYHTAYTEQYVNTFYPQYWYWGW
jgi:VCBS repeat-containing protein